MGFHVYRNKWKPVIGEVLKRCMEPQNEVDKYPVAVIFHCICFGHLPKGKSEKYAKTIFYFLKTDPLTFATLKLQERL